MNLDAKTIRSIWALVDNANPHTLVKLSDRELIKQLLKQVENITPLSIETIRPISEYLGSKTLLIRELAYQKID